MSDAEPYVLLATAADPSAAELCAALLRSAGIDSRLRGESLGPYRLTIGAMAATQIWVAASRLEDARSLVGEGAVPEVTLAEGVEAEPEPAPRRPPSLVTLVALGLLVLALALLLSRVF